MARILLLLLLLAKDSLQQDANSTWDADVPQSACASIIQKLDAMQQEQCVIGGQGAILNLTLDVATIKTSLAQRTQQIQSAVDKLDADAKHFAEKMTNNFKELHTFISSEFASIKAQNARCLDWKSKLGGLELEQIWTGAYFYFTHRGKNHSVASAMCEEKGMRLARFDSEEEMKIVVDNAPDKNNAYWVGATDVGSTPGEFRWQDGQPVQKELWLEGQPKKPAADTEACVWLYAKQGKNKLVDHWCGRSYHFICEVDATFLPCL